MADIRRKSDIETMTHSAKKIFFYIPGAESLHLLYFLADRYGDDLTVITPSVSVKEVCKIMGLSHIHPVFYSSSKVKESAWVRRFNNCKYTWPLRIFFGRVGHLIEMAIKIRQIKKMIELFPLGSTLYHSTFFYDVPGIIFLGSAIKSERLSVKLIWPSAAFVFDKTVSPSVVTEAYYLNCMTSALFTFHLLPRGGRVIGVNPEFLRINKIEFLFKNERIEKEIPKDFVERAVKSLELKSKSKPRVLFLGEYSVENGVSEYGHVYLEALKVLSEINSLDVYFKPHPLYESISHPLLNRMHVLDTQIPVEFFDDGSWLYIVGFATAALMTKKSSTCVSLLKLEEMGVRSTMIDETIEWMAKADNEIIYPENLNSLKLLLEGGVAPSQNSCETVLCAAH